MNEQTPEPEPIPVPEPTEIETVARLAAEAAVRALPDHSATIEVLVADLAEIRQTLTAAAGPNGGSAKLSARLEAAEQALAEQAAALAAEPQPNPGQQKILDDLRLKVATMERKKA